MTDSVRSGYTPLILPNSTPFPHRLLEAASAVTGLPLPDALDRMAGLVAQSLVVRRTAAEDAPPRFTMLETVRAFALERLAASDEADATRQRHAAWCLSLAEAAEPEFRVGTHKRRWGARLTDELANVRSAVAWFLATGHAPQGLRLL